jgi:hemoglobin
MTNFYERVGGSDTFADLVSQFYARVSMDPILKPMYPDPDMRAAAERLQMFLEQYWGGPSTYSELRGHPSLRARHGIFHIASPERDAWLSCMQGAIEGLTIEPELKEELWEYMQMAAHSLVNQPD